MTMPAPQGQTNQFPDLGYPRIAVMITENLVSTGPSDPTTMDWRMGGPHPIVPDMNVVAMYVNGDLVEVYSVSQSVTGAMRDIIQLRHTRLIQETMPLNIFAEELARAEMGPDDSDDDDDDDYDDSPPSPIRAVQPSPPVRAPAPSAQAPQPKPAQTSESSTSSEASSAPTDNGQASS